MEQTEDGSISLAAPTGDREVDAALGNTIALLERECFGHIRAYYLIGSWAYGDALLASDVDLVAVFRAGTEPSIAPRAREIVDAYTAQLTIDLGVYFVLDGKLPALASVQLSSGARPLYGEDIRPSIVSATPAQWTREHMHAMYLVAATGRSLSEVRLPLAPLQPHDEFLGYAVERKRHTDGTPRHGTRDLVTGAGWYATALAGYRSGALIARKVDVPALYRRHVGDEWTRFLEELFARCRSDWHYAVPDDPVGRLALRKLCARFLQFENHFLAEYRSFLLAELASGDEAKTQAALATLQRVPFRDAAVEEAVARLRARQPE